jgi:RimJ/RimL family protein N-acetyltransferase
MSQPIGPLVSQQGPAARPPGSTLHGQHITLTPLQPSHAPSSFPHLAGPENVDRWTYMLSGPYPTLPEWQSAITSWSGVEKDPLFYAALLKSDKGEEEAVGLLSYMNIVPDHRRVEIGSINLGAVLQRTRASTEAFYLFIKHAFEELGYLRVEWKANHLNAPSLAAAERLGFVFEGIFR